MATLAQFIDRSNLMRYRWIDGARAVVATAATLDDAGRQHRRMCRVDVRCIDRDGVDVTDAAIVASIEW